MHAKSNNKFNKTKAEQKNVNLASSNGANGSNRADNSNKYSKMMHSLTKDEQLPSASISVSPESGELQVSVKLPRFPLFNLKGGPGQYHMKALSHLHISIPGNDKVSQFSFIQLGAKRIPFKQDMTFVNKPESQTSMKLEHHEDGDIRKELPIPDNSDMKYKGHQFSKRYDFKFTQGITKAHPQGKVTYYFADWDNNQIGNLKCLAESTDGKHNCINYFYSKSSTHYENSLVAIKDNRKGTFTLIDREDFKVKKSWPAPKHHDPLHMETSIKVFVFNSSSNKLYGMQTEPGNVNWVKMYDFTFSGGVNWADKYKKYAIQLVQQRHSYKVGKDKYKQVVSFDGLFKPASWGQTSFNGPHIQFQGPKYAGAWWAATGWSMDTVHTYINGNDYKVLDFHQQNLNTGIRDVTSIDAINLKGQIKRHQINATDDYNVFTNYFMYWSGGFEYYGSNKLNNIPKILGLKTCLNPTDQKKYSCNGGEVIAQQSYGFMPATSGKKQRVDSKNNINKSIDTSRPIDFDNKSNVAKNDLKAWPDTIDTAGVTNEEGVTSVMFQTSSDPSNYTVSANPNYPVTYRNDFWWWNDGDADVLDPWYFRGYLGYTNTELGIYPGSNDMLTWDANSKVYQRISASSDLIPNADALKNYYENHKYLAYTNVYYLTSKDSISKEDRHKPGKIVRYNHYSEPVLTYQYNKATGKLKSKTLIQYGNGTKQDISDKQFKSNPFDYQNSIAKVSKVYNKPRNVYTIQWDRSDKGNIQTVAHWTHYEYHDDGSLKKVQHYKQKPSNYDPSHPDKNAGNWQYKNLGHGTDAANAHEYYLVKEKVVQYQEFGDQSLSAADHNEAGSSGELVDIKQPLQVKVIRHTLKNQGQIPQNKHNKDAYKHSKTIKIADQSQNGRVYFSLSLMNCNTNGQDCDPVTGRYHHYYNDHDTQDQPVPLGNDFSNKKHVFYPVLEKGTQRVYQQPSHIDSESNTKGIYAREVMYGYEWLDVANMSNKPIEAMKTGSKRQYYDETVRYKTTAATEQVVQVVNSHEKQFKWFDHHPFYLGHQYGNKHRVKKARNRQLGSLLKKQQLLSDGGKWAGAMVLKYQIPGVNASYNDVSRIRVNKQHYLYKNEHARPKKVRRTKVKPKNAYYSEVYIAPGNSDNVQLAQDGIKMPKGNKLTHYRHSKTCSYQGDDQKGNAINYCHIKIYNQRHQLIATANNTAQDGKYHIKKRYTYYEDIDVSQNSSSDVPNDGRKYYNLPGYRTRVDSYAIKPKSSSQPQGNRKLGSTRYYYSQSGTTKVDYVMVNGNPVFAGQNTGDSHSAAGAYWNASQYGSENWLSQKLKLNNISGAAAVTYSGNVTKGSKTVTGQPGASNFLHKITRHSSGKTITKSYSKRLGPASSGFDHHNTRQATVFPVKLKGKTKTTVEPWQGYSGKKMTATQIAGKDMFGNVLTNSITVSQGNKNSKAENLEYTYNASGQVTKLCMPEAFTHKAHKPKCKTYQYNNHNDVASITDWDGSTKTTYTYDYGNLNLPGKLSSVTVADNSKKVTVSYNYYSQPDDRNFGLLKEATRKFNGITTKNSYTKQYFQGTALLKQATSKTHYKMEVVSAVVRNYDQYGRVTDVLYKFNGGKLHTYKTTYTYDDEDDRPDRLGSSKLVHHPHKIAISRLKYDYIPLLGTDYKFNGGKIRKVTFQGQDQGLGKYNIHKKVQYYGKAEKQTGASQYQKGYFAPGGAVKQVDYTVTNPFPKALNQTFNYFYTPSGRLEEVDRGESYTQYKYDTSGNLTQMNMEFFKTSQGKFVNKQINYKYDTSKEDAALAAGLITDMSASSGNQGTTQQAHYKYGPNHNLTAYNGKTWQYDQNGNVIKDDRGYKYEYTPDGYLHTVSRPDGLKAWYTYDPAGRRIAKRVSLSQPVEELDIRFIYDGQKLVGEYQKHLKTNDGKAVFRTAYFGNGVMDVYQDTHKQNDDSYSHTVDVKFASDTRVASTIQYKILAETDQTGLHKREFNKAEAYEYTPFGTEIFIDTLASNAGGHTKQQKTSLGKRLEVGYDHMLYNGFYRDPETGFQVLGNGYRYLDNHTGIAMFLQPDGDLSQGINLYGWGGADANDPINYIDQTGQGFMKDLGHFLKGMYRGEFNTIMSLWGGHLDKNWHYHESATAAAFGIANVMSFGVSGMLMGIYDMSVNGAHKRDIKMIPVAGAVVAGVWNGVSPGNNAYTQIGDGLGEAAGQVAMMVLMHKASDAVADNDPTLKNNNEGFLDADNTRYLYHNNKQRAVPSMFGLKEDVSDSHNIENLKSGAMRDLKSDYSANRISAAVIERNKALFGKYDFSSPVDRYVDTDVLHPGHERIRFIRDDGTSTTIEFGGRNILQSQHGTLIMSRWKGLYDQDSYITQTVLSPDQMYNIIYNFDDEINQYTKRFVFNMRVSLPRYRMFGFKSDPDNNIFNCQSFIRKIIRTRNSQLIQNYEQSVLVESEGPGRQTMHESDFDSVLNE